jgi:hypothetical protein
MKRKVKHAPEMEFCGNMVDKSIKHRKMHRSVKAPTKSEKTEK